MDKNGWKIIAIIFIILFIVETALVISLFTIGKKEMDREYECSIICYNKNYQSFYFNSRTKLCTCYIGDKAVYHKFLK